MWKLLCCLAFSLAACSVPYKFEVFRLPTGQQDVIWVFMEGKLHRCWQSEGRPLCVAAHVTEEVKYPLRRVEAPRRPAPQPQPPQAPQEEEP